MRFSLIAKLKDTFPSRNVLKALSSGQNWGFFVLNRLFSKTRQVEKTPSQLNYIYMFRIFVSISFSAVLYFFYEKTRK